MSAPNPEPVPAGAAEHEAGAAPVARPAAARDDLAVITALLPYLRPYVGRILLALGLIIAAKLFNLVVPVVLKKIVDQLNVQPSLLVLPVALLLAYGASRISVTFFTELRQVVLARVMARASRQITLEVFRHLHALSLKFHLDRRTGGVARDVERGGGAVSDLLDWTLYTIVPTIVEVVFVTVVLVWALAVETLVRGIVSPAISRLLPFTAAHGLLGTRSATDSAETLAARLSSVGDGTVFGIWAVVAIVIGTALWMRKDS